MKTLRITIYTVVVLLLVGVAYVTLGYFYGPWSTSWSECYYCGRTRYCVNRLGFTWKLEVKETELSRWVDAVQPDHGDHDWCYSGGSSRWWFSLTLHYSGSIPWLLGSIHGSREHIGEEAAQQLLKEYHAAHREGVHDDELFARIHERLKP